MQPPKVLDDFAHGHLPREIAEVAVRFAELAEAIVREIPDSSNRANALHYLLISKDAACRARRSAIGGVMTTIPRSPDEVR